MTSARLLTGLALGLLLGCTGGDPAQPDPDGPSTEPDVAGEVGAVVDPSGLVARMRPMGGSGQVPEAFFIHLDSGHFSEEQVGQPAPEGTELRFEPEVKGRLVVSARNTLRFDPEGGFRPGTTYKAILDQVGLPEESRPRPEGAEWETEFTTP